MRGFLGTPTVREAGWVPARGVSRVDCPLRRSIWSRVLFEAFGKWRAVPQIRQRSSRSSR
eukprot:13654769-Alexandrium_andersonii.AAC.1